MEKEIYIPSKYVNNKIFSHFWLKYAVKSRSGYTIIVSNSLDAHL